MWTFEKMRAEMERADFEAHPCGDMSEPSGFWKGQQGMTYKPLEVHTQPPANFKTFHFNMTISAPTWSFLSW